LTFPVHEVKLTSRRHFPLKNQLREPLHRFGNVLFSIRTKFPRLRFVPFTENPAGIPSLANNLDFCEIGDRRTTEPRASAPSGPSGQFLSPLNIYTPSPSVCVDFYFFGEMVTHAREILYYI